MTLSKRPVPSKPLASGPLLATLGLAVVFAVLIMLPSLLQRFDARYPYQGIHILGPDAEVYYAARVQEVYDGFPSLGNTFFSAPKDQPAMQPPLPEQTIAFTGKLLGLESLDAFLLSKVFLAVAVFLVLTWLLLIVTGRPWISLLAAVAALEAGALLAAPWDLPIFLRADAGSLEFLRFSRAINPQWTSTFFLLDLCFLALWSKTGKKLPLVLSALCSGMLVYSYVYAWTYFFAVAGVLSLWHLARRDIRKIADLMIFWVIVIVIFTPYAIHLAALAHHPWYLESSQRFGLVLRHGPAVFSVWSAVFIGLALSSRVIWPRTWPFLPAVALAGFIAFNQQLITGHHIVHHHYNWYFVQPLASVFACAMALSLLAPHISSARLRATGGVLIVLVCAWVAVTEQRIAYNGRASFWGELQQAAPVIEFVSKNLRVGQVVYSQDITMLNHIPAYGSADVYNSNNAYLSLTPDERVRFGYFLDVWLQGLTPEQAVEEFPTSRRFLLSTRIHAIYYREAADDFINMPDEDVEENIALYKEFYGLPIRDKLTRYPITAVVTTPSDPQNPVWSAFLSCSREVFAKNGYGVRLMIQPGYPGSCL